MRVTIKSQQVYHPFCPCCTPGTVFALSPWSGPQCPCVSPISAAEPLSSPATWDIEILTSAPLLPLGTIPIGRVGKLTSTAAGVNIKHLNMHREQHNYITLFSEQK